MRRHLFPALGAAVAALATAPPLHAQDDEALDRTPETCITVSRVQQTRVVDDQTILFYMRGRAVYRSELRNACPRLAQEDRFAYETRIGRLCETDTIWVLESFGGRFQRGATCRLGTFHPITAQEAADIVAGPEGARRAAESVDTEEVELPEEDDDEEADDASGQGAQGEPDG